jgi:radical SAM superfamily enzyme YgiQ (UPF0313 family)
MKILLVQPRITHIPSKIYHFLGKINNKLFVPSLTLEQLAALTPEQHDIHIIDERIGQKIRFNNYYDVVGISPITSCVNRAYEIADRFRKQDVPVILGGHHPSALPKEAKQHADSVLIGEAEYTWPQLLADLEKHRLKKFYHQDQIVNPNDIPAANREYTKGKYFFAALQATRGCPNRCEFCAISYMKLGAVYRERPIENVIEEIRTIPQHVLYFYDASLTTNPSYSKALFKEMGEEFNRTFSCNGNVNVLERDEELLKLASDAGCSRWYIGFESFSQDNINLIGKKSNKIETYAPAIKKIRDYGMDVTGLFMFGLDYDTPEVFRSTLEIINHDLELSVADFYCLTPFPGTPLFHRMEKEGRILTKDWSKYHIDNVVIQPKNMTSEELLEGVHWIRKEFYGIQNLIHHPNNMFFSLPLT